MRRTNLFTMMVVTTAIVLTVTMLGSPASGTMRPSDQRDLLPTPYLLAASGYGSRVVGGDVPAGSDKSAYQIFACTNRAGIHRSNSQADVDLGNGLKLENVKTMLRSTQKGGVVTTWSRNAVERLVLADTPLGSLYLEGVASTSRAWHDGSGFHSASTARLADIVLEPATGDPQHFEVPLPGQSVTIPGLATISLGVGSSTHHAHGAATKADAVKVELLPTGTKVYVAHSSARISDGVRKALYGGVSYAATADVLEGVVTSGKTPNRPTPCLGTDGEIRSRDLAEVDVSSGVVAQALSASTQAGTNDRGQPFVNNIAKVAHVDLGHNLIVTGVKGRAHVVRKHGDYTTSTGGTTVGRITLNGERLEFPDSGPIEIPGIARIEPRVINRGHHNVSVAALRITLLDGRAAVIHLGVAKARLVPSGL